MRSTVISTVAPEPAPAAPLDEQIPRRGRSSLATRIIAAAVTVPSLAIVATLALVAYLGFRTQGVPNGAFTLENYVRVYADPFVYQAALNTVVFVGVTIVVALALGVPLAWLVERTDLGFRSAIYTGMVIRLLIPGFVTAMGWVFMFHPRIGFINQWLEAAVGLSGVGFNVISLYGMGIVQGLSLSGLVFVMVSNSLRTMDSSLEESARMSGAGTLEVLRRVTLPMMAPSLLGATLFVGAIAIAAFDVPLVIGLADNIIVFSTYVFLASNPVEGLPEYGVPAAFSTFMIVLALGVSWWYTRVLGRAHRYEVITGKGYKPTVLRLDRWRNPARAAVATYFLLTMAAPLLFTIWVSVVPFVQPPSVAALDAISLSNFRDLSWGQVQRGLVNTLKVMALAPALTLIASVLFSWVVLRSRLRIRKAYDYVAFMPQAVPNIIFALGALFVALYWTRGWYDLYGSVTLIVLVTALVFIPFATRMINGALIQISGELEEAAAMSGAATFATLRRVTIPLLRPVLVFTWLWLAMLAFRELTIPTLLSTGGNDTVAVVAWAAWQIGRAGHASAISVVMLVLLVPLVVVYLRLTRADRLTSVG